MEATMTVYTDYLEFEVDFDFYFVNEGDDLEMDINKVSIVEQNRKIVVPFSKLRKSIQELIEKELEEEAIERLREVRR